MPNANVSFDYIWLFLLLVLPSSSSSEMNRRINQTTLISLQIYIFFWLILRVSVHRQFFILIFIFERWTTNGYLVNHSPMKLSEKARSFNHSNFSDLFEVVCDDIDKVAPIHSTGIEKNITHFVVLQYTLIHQNLRT